MPYRFTFSTAYEAINIAIDDSPDDTSTAHNNFGYDGDDDGDGGSELLDAHYHHREDQANAKVRKVDLLKNSQLGF